MAKLLLKVLLFCIVCVTQSNALSSDGTDQLETLEKARSFIGEMKLDSAEYYLLSLSDSFEEQKQWEQYASCLNGLAECRWRIYDLEKAEEYARASLQVCQSFLPKGNKQTVQSLRHLGIVSFYKDNYDESEDYLTQAKKILEKADTVDYEMMFKINRVLAAIYLYQGDVVKGLRIYQYELDNTLSNQTIDSLNLIIAYSNVGKAYLSMFHLDSAEYFLQKTVEITKEVFDETHINLAIEYRHLSYLHVTKGELHRALNYASSAEKIYKDFYGEESGRVADVYHALATIYVHLGNSNQALNYANKGLNLVVDDFGLEHSDAANFHEVLASIYGKLNNDSLEYKHLKKSLEIRKDVFGEQNRFVAESYNDLGDYNYIKLDFENAITNYNKALKILKSLARSKNSEIAYSNIGVAQSYLKQGENFELALVHFNRAIETNTYVRDAKGSLLTSQYLNDHYQLLAFMGKASTHLAMDHLQEALGGFQQCDTLIHQLRWNNISWEDQFSLSERVKDTYDQAVSLCIRLYKETNQRDYLNLALNFYENSRVSILKKALAKMDDNKLGILPDEMVAFERTIDVNIEYFESLVKREKVKEKKDPLKISSYEESLFKLNGEKDSFELILKKSFPDYYKAKHRHTSISIDEIQKGLDSRTGLFEFFKTDSVLFSFALTHDEIKVFSHPIDSTFDRRLSEFIFAFKSEERISEISVADTIFTKEAHYWYEQLLKTPLDSLGKVERLQIIPDGILSYLPFEALLKTPASSDSYKSLDYLIRHYDISYKYSLDQVLMSDLRKGNKVVMSYLGYAPSYKKSGNQVAQISEQTEFRNSLQNLNWNQFEVKQIGEQMNGKYYLSEDATETSFKEFVNQSNIIHLATHALIDDLDPMKSKFVFSQENDSLNDGYLHTYELFDLKLNPELVVLSACNTGVGELKDGEGIMSLAYGFAYSGCTSIVSSLWPVDDKSTSELMSYFYEGLDQGMTKSKALRVAKLKMIDQSGAFSANPFYWGAFVLIGNDDPLEDIIDRKVLFTAFFLLVFVTGFFYVKKRNGHNSL
ncbi:CHAT domain-containing protein [Reichenbachiella sp.]